MESEQIHGSVTFCQNSQSYWQIPVIQESKRISIKETDSQWFLYISHPIKSIQFGQTKH